MRSLCLFFAACLAMAAGVDFSIGRLCARGRRRCDARGRHAGAFVTSSTDHAGAISFSFSGRLGILKLASTIRVLDGEGALVSESDAPEGPAMIGFNAHGDSAIVYYPATQSLALFRDGSWQPLPTALAGHRRRDTL